MIADRLRAAILQAAISGKLTKQHPEDGTAEELLETIKTKRQQLEKEGKIKKQKPLPPVDKTDEPFDLPGTWAYPALGEIVTLIRGITFPASAKHKESFTGAVRCLTTGSVQSRYSDSADVFVDASFVKRSDQYLSRGDAILSTANSTALVGKSIYWDEAHERTFGGFLTVARAMDSRPAATRYLHTVLRTLFLGGAFAEKSTQTTNIANLSNKILYGVRIPLPPAAEQERIVAKLDEVLPLIDQLAELEREREAVDRTFARALERAILHAAISGKLTKQHPEDGTAEELLETIKTEHQQLEKEGKIKKQKPLPSVETTDEPFELPDTWEWAQIGSIVDLINGRAYKRQELQTSGKWPVLRVGNLFTNETLYYSDLDLEDDKYCSNGDLLYAWSASFGPHIWRGEKSIFHYHIWKVRHYSMNRDYLNYVLQWDVERIRTATTGSTMVHVSMTNMRPRTIPVAPIKEQDRIVKRLDSLLPLVDQICKLVL